MRKKKTLRTSLLSTSIVVVVLLSAVLAYAGFRIYSADMIKFYQNYAGDTIDFLARGIDGDDLQDCINTGVKSEKYKELQRLMNDVKETHDLIYIYIVKPSAEEPPYNIVDVMAAVTQFELDHESDELTDLWVAAGDLYPPEVTQKYLERMDKNPAVTYFRNDTEFGRIYTAIRPVFNSKGEPVAVICGDIEIDDILGAAWTYMLMAGITALVFAASTLVLLNIWFGRRIIRPISKLQESAGEFENKCHMRADLAELVMNDPEIHTGDEIEALADAIVSMVEDVQDYASDLVEKEQLISAKDCEISSMQDHVSKLDALAYSDVLTGAGNKTAYEKAVVYLNNEMMKGNVRFALVMADLNHLKLINDSYGHDKGNAYIKGMYKYMKEGFKESSIYRIGGDEFVVIAQGEEMDQCGELIEKIRENMHKSMENAGLEPWERVSAAMGYAVFEEGDDVEAVFRRADSNMYADKKRMHELELST